jgi:hypothetical protein
MAEKLNFTERYKLDLATIDEPIAPDTVISHAPDYTPVCYFGDDTWDFTLTEGVKLSFTAWRTEATIGPLADQITQEIKTLWWRWICTPQLGLRSNKKSWDFYQRMLSKLARMMYLAGTSLVGAENHDEFQSRLRLSLVNAHSDTTWTNSYGNTLKKILGLCQKLSHILPADCKTHMRLLPPDAYAEIVPVLNRMTHNADVSKKRTPLIPSRIYATLITQIRNEFSLLMPHLGVIEQVAARLTSDHGDRKDAAISIETILIESMGEQRLNHPLFRSGSYKVFKQQLGHLQKRCIAAIELFTGMRQHEVAVLPFNSIERSVIPNFGEINCIVSHTSKMNGGSYSEALRWVTDESGAQAVMIAQAIARCLFKFKQTGVIPEVNFPLWLSPMWKAKSDAHYDYTRRTLKNRKPVFSVEIIQADIDELVAFDGLRDWAGDPKFSVGKIWPFASHQFRRSLAVYASRSGLVSLPDLAVQLKHLSQVMTALYTENSAFAENFIADERGIISGSTHDVVHEFRAAQMLGLANTFHRNVIEAETPLSGGNGARIQTQKDRDKLPKIYKNRKATEKAMREGRITYHETVVGGCARKEICDAYGVDDVLPCVFRCGDAIIGGDGGEKLKKYAESLQWGLDELDEGSAPYRTTIDELELIRAKLLNEEGIYL